MVLRKMNIICAMEKSGGIGSDGNLPWRLRKEFDHFVSMTLSVEDKLKRNVVVMARRTWESIPVSMRPLRQRVNVVVTRQTDYVVKDGVHVVHSLEQALELLSSEPLSSEIETIWNLGGVSIYKESLEKHYVHRLYLTRIVKDYRCDAVFPNYNKDHYVEIKDERVPDGVQEENDVQWTYETYQAKAN